jgi:dTDP-4-amino-4,6-dideoxygalactose transaminase
MTPAEPDPAGATTLPLGGFFGLETAGRGDLARRWGLTADLAWENATAALAALVRQLRPGAVWLPGYLCGWTVRAVPQDLRRFFPLTAGMQPDQAALAGVRSGDIVLAVDYFGQAPGPDWRDFVAAHPGVIFVEDAAQALDTGEAPWGDWRLHSPRKLTGVPEGGLLVALTAKARAVGLRGPSLAPDAARTALRRAPMRTRQADPMANRAWVALHDAAEASFAAADRAMDPEAFALLASLDPTPMARARRENYRRLARPLAALALLADPAPAFAPLGFPIRLPADRRDAVLRALYARRIFPAVHWRDLAAPPGFAADHALGATLVTLPSDHRYGPDDMDRLARAVLEINS